ncbi:MAG: hypothetical protein AAFX06_00960 [Planctomycetota bacterium]
MALDKHIVYSLAEWVVANERALYKDSQRELTQGLRDREESVHFTMGASLGWIAVWLIGKGQIEVLRNDKTGWESIGLGFRYRRAQLLCELWSKLYDKTRSSFATRRLVAELLLFSALGGDERLEAFCSRLMRESFKNDLVEGMGESPDFIALIDAKNLAAC